MNRQNVAGACAFVAFGITWLFMRFYLVDALRGTEVGGWLQRLGLLSLALPFAAGGIAYALVSGEAFGKESPLTPVRNPPPAPPQAPAQPIAVLSLATVQSRWDEWVQQVSRENSRVGALLGPASPFSIDDEYITILVPFEFHRVQLSEPDVEPLLERTLEQVFGILLGIEVIDRETAAAYLKLRKLPEQVTALPALPPPVAAPSRAPYANPVEDDGWADSLAEDDQGVDEYGLPPLEVYNTEGIQELREVLKADLQQYNSLFQQGALNDAATAEWWMGEHPEFRKFLQWYRTEHGEKARQESRDQIHIVIEYYLFWEWV